MVPGTGALFGVSNTQVVSELLSTYAYRGDFADTTQALASLQPYGYGLPTNVGMAAQFAENTFYTNMGSSSYNGLLTTLHKNVGYGLQFDLNYTWSHSIDNVSLIANQAAYGGYGFICDVLRPRECRANSDFDVTQYFNGNFIYDLPFGRGKYFGSGASRWLDEAHRRLEPERSSQRAQWASLLCRRQRVCGGILQQRAGDSDRSDLGSRHPLEWRSRPNSFWLYESYAGQRRLHRSGWLQHRKPQQSARPQVLRHGYGTGQEISRSPSGYT